jgi:hypothetical protein
LAAFAVAFTVPFRPAEVGEIAPFDYSWMLVVHDAFARGRQFGTELILPQGPLAFVGTSVFDPRTFGVLLAARMAIALAVALVLWGTARRTFKQLPVALAWSIAFVALVGKSPDHLLPGCAILLVFSYFFVSDRKCDRTVYVLIVLLAAASLIKVNQPFFAAIAVLAVALDQIVQRRRRSFAPPLLFLVAWLAFYVEARQKLSSLWPMLRGWVWVTFGHAEAVGIPGPFADVLAHLIVVVVLLWAVGIVALRRWGRAGVVSLAATGGMLLLLYKHSFLRQDSIHVQIAPMVALATAVLYLPIAWQSGEHAKRAAVIATTLAAGVLGSILWTSDCLDALTEIPARCAANLAAIPDCVKGAKQTRARWEAGRAGLRHAFPLPTELVEGPVDVYPHRQDVLFAHDFPYRPRPAVSSLVATSPKLAQLDAACLRDASTAPRTILFDVSPVDHNFPTMLDGASLPELLSRFDVVDDSQSMLVLRRAENPRNVRATLLFNRVVHFDDVVQIPDVHGGSVIWAHVRLRRTLAGKVLAAAYKPATVSIRVVTQDGEPYVYRLLPQLADEQGFLLSPLIRDRSTYARLARSVPAESDPVTLVRLDVIDGSRAVSFENRYEIELERLDFESVKTDTPRSSGTGSPAPVPGR